MFKILKGQQTKRPPPEPTPQPPLAPHLPAPKLNLGRYPLAASPRPSLLQSPARSGPATHVGRGAAADENVAQVGNLRHRSIFRPEPDQPPPQAKPRHFRIPWQNLAQIAAGALLALAVLFTYN